MSNVRDLLIKLRLSADGRQLRSEVQRTNNDLGSMRNQVGQLSGMLGRVAGLFGVAFGTREIGRMAEEYTTLNNRLALVTSSEQELANAKDAVFEAAQRARQPLTATAELYQRIATNADALHLSGDGVAGVVDTISKSLAVSGTSAASAEAALIQLGQAFASGQLRGEELNSVLEQAPALARAVADGLGVTVGELRTLGESGALSAENVIQALQRSAGKVDEQFGKMQVTGGQALTTLNNSLTRVVGEINEATGASSLFADGIMELSAWLDTGALTDGVVTAYTIWSATFDAVAGDLAALGLDFNGLAATSTNTSQSILEDFIQGPAYVRAAVQGAVAETITMFNRVVAYAEYASDMIGNAFNGTAREAAGKKLDARLAEIKTEHDTKVTAILNERQAILDTGAADRQAREEARKATADERERRKKAIEELRKNTGTVNLSGTGKGAGRKAGGTSKDPDEEAARMVAQLRQQLALLGDTTNAARVRYELESGSLTAVNAKLADRLQLVARELDEVQAQHKLQEAAKQYAETLQQQIDLHEQTTEAAKLGYELEKGKLAGLNAQERERLQLLAAQRDEQQRQTERRGTVDRVLQEREDHLPASQREDLQHQRTIGDLTSYRDSLGGGEIEEQQRVNQAIEAEQQRHAEAMKGINSDWTASFSAAWSESFDRFAAGIGQVASAALFESGNLKEGFDQLVLGSAKQMVATLAEIGVKRLALAMIERTIGQTSAATSQATMAATGASIATAMTPAAVMTSIATMGGATAAASAGMAATMAMAQGLNIVGMAHDGLGRVPAANEGTWLMKKDEMVLNPAQADNFGVLLDFVKQQRQGASTAPASGGNGGLYVTVNNNGGEQLDVASTKRSSINDQDRAEIILQTKRELVRDLQTGGDLATTGESLYGWKRAGR